MVKLRWPRSAASRGDCDRNVGGNQDRMRAAKASIRTRSIGHRGSRTYAADCKGAGRSQSIPSGWGLGRAVRCSSQATPVAGPQTPPAPNPRSPRNCALASVAMPSNTPIVATTIHCTPDGIRRFMVIPRQAGGTRAVENRHSEGEVNYLGKPAAEPRQLADRLDNLLADPWPASFQISELVFVSFNSLSPVSDPPCAPPRPPSSQARAAGSIRPLQGSLRRFGGGGDKRFLKVRGDERGWRTLASPGTHQSVSMRLCPTPSIRTSSEGLKLICCLPRGSSALAHR